MAKLSLILFTAAALLASSCKEETAISVQTVNSEIARCSDGSYLDGMQGKLKWNYTTGLELKAFLDVSERYGIDSIAAYAENWYDRMIDDEGNILTYKKSKYNTDHICPGVALFKLYDRTGNPKYKMAMDTLRSQISGQPRTSEGGFWHKAIYPSQMWLDGLYMAQPFYAEYTRRYEPEETKDSCYRDILNHFLVVARHTYDPATKLYRHAWDESKAMFWSNPETGQSEHAWGRALGWYCMAMVEVLEIVPKETEGWKEANDILKGIYAVLPEYADPKTGMWYQVLDRPGAEGNYVEATCSAMFVYAMLKGTRIGLLDASLRPDAEKAYSNLLDTFTETSSEGILTLTQCCAVAGLGGKDNRSGNYEYYINERICDNDPKGMGPLIWASLEMEK